MKINMLGVFTDQFTVMKDFYVQVLGFEILEELESYVEFGGQPMRVALCERKVMQQATGDPAFEKRAEGSPLEFAFECASNEDLDTQFQELIAQGARKVKSPAVMPWNQYAGFFADPDGHVHELFCNLK